MQHTHVDYLSVNTYDNQTGSLTLQGIFKNYHWGAPNPPADNDEWGGIDMRGEVILLSRNIVIEGEDVDGWGGSILTTDLRLDDAYATLT